MKRVTVGPPTAGGRGASTTTTDVDASKRSLDTKTERDCTADPTQGRCKETSAAHVGPDGVMIGARREEVTAVKEPKSWALNFTVDGFFTYGTSTDSDIDDTDRRR